MDNIKDINLINSDLKTAKEDIDDLKRRLSLLGANSSATDKEGSTGYGINEVADNLNKELKKYEDQLKTVFQRLGSAEDNIQKLQEQLKRLQQSKGKEGSQNNNQSSGGVSDKEFEQLKKELKDKFDVVHKKMNDVQAEINHHDQEIGYIKDLLAQDQEKDSSDKNKTNISKEDLLELKKKIEEVNDREKKDYKHLLE